jgi:hypothetical protein
VAALPGHVLRDAVQAFHNPVLRRSSFDLHEAGDALTGR